MEHHLGAAAAIAAAAASLNRELHETQRISPQPCRGGDRSMGMQECERAGSFLYRMDDWLFASFANCITSAFLLSLSLKRDELNSCTGILDAMRTNKDITYLENYLFPATTCIFSNLFRMESYFLGTHYNKKIKIRIFLLK